MRPFNASTFALSSCTAFHNTAMRLFNEANIHTATKPENSATHSSWDAAIQASTSVAERHPEDVLRCSAHSAARLHIARVDGELRVASDSDGTHEASRTGVAFHAGLHANHYVWKDECRIDVDCRPAATRRLAPLQDQPVRQLDPACRPNGSTADKGERAGDAQSVGHRYEAARAVYRQRVVDP